MCFKFLLPILSWELDSRFLGQDKLFIHIYSKKLGFPSGSVAKNLPAMQEMRARFLGQEDPLEMETAPHSSFLAWEIPMDQGAWWAIVHGLQRVRHNLATKNIVKTVSVPLAITFSLLRWFSESQMSPHTNWDLCYRWRTQGILRVYQEEEQLSPCPPFARQWEKIFLPNVHILSFREG